MAESRPDEARSALRAAAGRAADFPEARRDASTGGDAQSDALDSARSKTRPAAAP
jgi:hypothetical protein